MKYVKKPISEILRSPKTVFTFKDVVLIWGENDKRAAIAAVNYYVKTKQLVRIRRGIYAKNKNYNKIELATRVYTPAYVSFETILGQSGINFQYYSQIFVASCVTRNIVIDNQIFSYKKIKQSILINPIGIGNDHETSMATPERAFLDTLYIHTDYHFDHLDSLDWNRVFEILPIYQNKRMEKKVKELHAYTIANK